MTRKEFDSYGVEDFEQMKESIQKRTELSSQIEDIDKSLEPIIEALDSLDIQIDEWIEKYNQDRSLDTLNKLQELKEQQIELLTKQAELEAQKAEKEEELAALEEKKKEESVIIKFIKDKAIDFKNKLSIKKDEMKLPKKGVKQYKEKNLDRIKLSEKVSGVFKKIAIKAKEIKQGVQNKVEQVKESIKEKMPEIKEGIQEKAVAAKEWVKDDLKKGVVYNTVETVKEKMPEIKENVQEKAVAAKEWVKDDLKKGIVYNTVETVKEKMPEIKENISMAKQKVGFKINRAKSAIARAPKKAITGIKNTFERIAKFVGDKKTVVVAKTERFINIQKAKIEARHEFKEEIGRLKEEKKENLQKYREHLMEQQRLAMEAAEREYQEKIATAKSL